MKLFKITDLLAFSMNFGPLALRFVFVAAFDSVYSRKSQLQTNLTSIRRYLIKERDSAIAGVFGFKRYALVNIKFSYFYM